MKEWITWCYQVTTDKSEDHHMHCNCIPVKRTHHDTMIDIIPRRGRPCAWLWAVGAGLRSWLLYTCKYCLSITPTLLLEYTCTRPHAPSTWFVIWYRSSFCRYCISSENYTGSSPFSFLPLMTSMGKGYSGGSPDRGNHSQLPQNKFADRPIPGA
jgi:hypothetical protein